MNNNTKITHSIKNIIYAIKIVFNITPKSTITCSVNKEIPFSKEFISSNQQNLGGKCWKFLNILNTGLNH